MALPLLKLGTLALKTLSKPVASRIKTEAGLHPKFRNFIVGIAQRVYATISSGLLWRSLNVVLSVGSKHFPVSKKRIQSFSQSRRHWLSNTGNRNDKMIESVVDFLGSGERIFFFSHDGMKTRVWRTWTLCKVNFNHRMTTTMQRRLYGHATDVEIRPLNEEKAVQAAVDLMGDVFVFSVAVAALFFEVQRSSRSEAKKEEIRKQEMEGIRQRDDELQKEVELLKQKLAEIEQLATSRGIAGAFGFRHMQTEDNKSIPASA